MIFKLKDTDVQVILEKEHVDTMGKFVRASGINETGGIILGHYTDATTAIITKIVGPPSDSKSGRFWFIRGVKGLASLLVKAWEVNEYYLGEWHYHPNGTITPSQQDLRQMKKISQSNRYNCPEPIMIIIAGSYKVYDIGVFLTDKGFGKTFSMEKFP